VILNAKKITYIVLSSFWLVIATNGIAVCVWGAIGPAFPGVYNAVVPLLVTFSVVAYIIAYGLPTAVDTDCWDSATTWRDAVIDPLLFILIAVPATFLAFLCAALLLIIASGLRVTLGI